MLNNRLDLNGNRIILVVIYFKYNGSCVIRNWTSYLICFSDDAVFDEKNNISS